MVEGGGGGIAITSSTNAKHGEFKHIPLRPSENESDDLHLELSNVAMRRRKTMGLTWGIVVQWLALLFLVTLAFPNPINDFPATA